MCVNMWCLLVGHLIANEVFTSMAIRCSPLRHDEASRQAREKFIGCYVHKSKQNHKYLQMIITVMLNK